MTREQKALLDQARAEGKLAMEYSPEFIVHGMVDTMRNQMVRYEVGYKKLSQQQQDTVLAELQHAAEGIAHTVARMIHSAGSQTVNMTLKDLKVSNGQVTGMVKADEDYYNDLISKVQDKGEVLIVLYPREFSAGMADIQSEKDQRSLPLDDEKPARKPRTKKAIDEPKAIEIPKKFLDDARDFVTIQQNCTVAGLQNQMRCGFDKAVAVLDKLAEEGIVKRTGDSPNDQFELVRDKPGAEASPKDADGLPTHYGELTYSEVQQTVVLHAKSFYLPWLSDRFNIEGEQAEHLALRLLDDGVIQAEQSDVVEGEPPLVTYKVIATLADLDLPF
jgi:ribosomal protein S25